MENLFCLMTDDDYSLIANTALDGFMPSDVETLCKLTGEQVLVEVANATYFKPCSYRKGQWVPANPLDPDAVLLLEDEINICKTSTSPVILQDVKTVLDDYEPDGRKITEEHLSKLREFQRRK